MDNPQTVSSASDKMIGEAGQTVAACRFSYAQGEESPGSIEQDDG